MHVSIQIKLLVAWRSSRLPPPEDTTLLEFSSPGFANKTSSNCATRYIQKNLTPYSIILKARVIIRPMKGSTLSSGIVMKMEAIPTRKYQIQMVALPSVEI